MKKILLVLLAALASTGAHGHAQVAYTLDSTSVVKPSFWTLNANAAKTGLGLNNVQNVDTTNANNITSGTLLAARLPASVPLLDPADHSLTLPGTLVVTGGSVQFGPDSGYISLGNYGGSLDLGGGGGSVYTGNGGGSIDTGNFGGSVITNDGGSINTSDGGGYIVTNGFGAPTDTSAPIGSIYIDQDPSGQSGHVFWVMENGGWVGLDNNSTFNSVTVGTGQGTTVLSPNYVAVLYNRLLTKVFGRVVCSVSELPN